MCGSSPNVSPNLSLSPTSRASGAGLGAHAPIVSPQPIAPGAAPGAASAPLAPAGPGGAAPSPVPPVPQSPPTPSAPGGAMYPGQAAPPPPTALAAGDIRSTIAPQPWGQMGAQAAPSLGGAPLTAASSPMGGILGRNNIPLTPQQITNFQAWGRSGDYQPQPASQPSGWPSAGGGFPANSTYLNAIRGWGA